MITPVNQINNKQGYFYLKPAIKNDKSLHKNPSLELSGYQTGMAILSRNDISFKNLSAPADVTDKYNKPLQGEGHPDLSNIHIYEYPDTHLHVVMDVADNIECPAVEMELYNFHKINYNPVHAELVNLIMNERLNKTSDNVFYAQIGDYAVYGSCDDKNSVQNIDKLHNTVLNSEFSSNELEKAKAKLKDYISSSEYRQKNIDLMYLYPKELMKNNKELYNDISKVSVRDLSEFYNSYLKSCSPVLYVSVSKIDFENNKENYLSKFNKNIPLKFQKYDNEEKIEKFIPNKELRVIKSEYGFMPLEYHFPISMNNEKEKIISDFVSLLLLGNHYTVLDKNYDLPINIKNSKDITGGCYYNIGVNANISSGVDINSELQKLYEHVNKVYNSDISAELETAKSVKKQDIKYDSTENTDSYQRLNFIKSINMNFNVYELVDSITEKDIKDYISKYILNQKPIIHINKECEFNS